MKITFKVAEAKKTMPILTIEEKNNHLTQSTRSRDAVHPKHLMKPSQTLYYPQLEIAKVKEFFYHRKPKEFIHASATDETNAASYTNLSLTMVLLITSIHRLTL